MIEKKKNNVAKKETSVKSVAKKETNISNTVATKSNTIKLDQEKTSTVLKKSKVSELKTEKKATKIKKSADFSYATGKRKNAIAKVWLTNGTGKITVNGKSANDYLKRPILNVIINKPFDITETNGKFDIDCTVLGGGLSGQAGAIKHGISIALQLSNPALRSLLKSAGFLTRDSRVVERKKPGLKKARKGQVYQRR